MVNLNPHCLKGSELSVCYLPASPYPPGRGGGVFAGRLTRMSLRRREASQDGSWDRDFSARSTYTAQNWGRGWGRGWGSRWTHIHTPYVHMWMLIRRTQTIPALWHAPSHLISMLSREVRTHPSQRTRVLPSAWTCRDTCMEVGDSYWRARQQG